MTDQEETWCPDCERLQAEVERLREAAKHTRIAYEVLCQTGERHALDAVMEKQAALQEGE